MIWIIAGTSEARQLIDRISDLNSYVATVATEDGREFIRTNNLLVGRMNYEQMIVFAGTNDISLIVDMTHPYARAVSENAKKVAKKLKLKYIRYARHKTDISSNSIYLKGLKEAYGYISKLNGTLFFTTGSKNIEDFERIRASNRFVYRVLPALESIKKCSDCNISLKNIVAMLGPFSEEHNKSIFKEYKADYVVMKDSGVNGGSLEKIKACDALGIVPIIIGRDQEDGISSLDKIESIIRDEIYRRD